MQEFNLLSAYFAKQKILAKRISNTRLEALYKSQFVTSKCARDVRRKREKCHKIEAHTNKADHERLLRHFITGIWTSDETTPDEERCVT